MLQVNTSHRAALPPAMLRTPHAATSMPASADAELVALGERLKPIFEQWRRQIATASASMTVAARERLYRQNDQLHRDASELIDEIISCKATTIDGIAVQVRAALVDSDIDALVLDPDPRLRGFLASLSAFAGVAFPS
jgi:hypothetical protein